MLGVDEIDIEIEEPFCILPVRPLCDMCDRDRWNFGAGIARARLPTGKEESVKEARKYLEARVF